MKLFTLCLVLLAASASAGTLIVQSGSRPAPPAGGSSALEWDAASLAEGQTITFTTDGTYNFGAQGPTTKLYFDGRGKTPGATTLTTDPEIGTWLSVSASANWVNASHPNSSASSQIIEGASVRQHVFGVSGSGYHGLEEFQEVFIAWSSKDTTGVFPSEADLERNVKEAWMMLGNRGDNTAVGGTNHGHDLYINGISSPAGGPQDLAGAIAGNETTTSWFVDVASSWSLSGWNRQHFAAKLNSSSPYGTPLVAFYQQCSVEGFTHDTPPNDIMDDQTGEGVSIAAWDRIKFSGFFASQTGDERVFDDVYVATGPGAIARVMLADSNVQANITKSGFLLVDSWSSSQIVGVLKYGTIDPDIDPVWAWIYDEDNQFIASVQLQ